jgi:alkylated DNA nucleotide flippase Atl1
MMGTKKSWRQKLADSKGLPKVVKIEGKMSRKWGEGTCAIAAPAEVDEIMRKVPKGRLITINEIRAIIARKHNATIGCPITTGIFAWIAAHAAEEDRADGKKRITPYWRTLKTGGLLNEKYPGGIDAQKKNLEAEGHKVAHKGRSKNLMVADYEQKLVGI